MESESAVNGPSPPPEEEMEVDKNGGVVHEAAGNGSEAPQIDVEVDFHPLSRKLYAQSQGELVLGLELLSPLHDVNQAIFTPVVLDMAMEASTMDLLREGLTLALERPDILDEDDDASLIAFHQRTSRVFFGAHHQSRLDDQRRVSLLDTVERMQEVQEDVLAAGAGNEPNDSAASNAIKLAMSSALEEVVIHGTPYNFVLLVSASGCGDNDDAATADSVADEVMRSLTSVSKHGQCVRIYAVGIGQEYNRPLLRNLAEKSHGMFVHAEDGYVAVQHIQEMLAQFSTLVATDVSVSLSSTHVNGEALIRSLSDVSQAGDVCVMNGNSWPGTYEIRFGDAFAEESYQKLIRLELDLSQIQSEHDALPIASCVVSYSKADGVYEEFIDVAFDVQTLLPDMSSTTPPLGLPSIFHLVPRPINVPDGVDAELDHFVMGQLTRETECRVSAELQRLESASSEDQQLENARVDIASECLYIINALRKWPTSGVTKRQQESLESLKEKLIGCGGVEREVEMPRFEKASSQAEVPETTLTESSSDGMEKSGKCFVLHIHGCLQGRDWDCWVQWINNWANKCCPLVTAWYVPGSTWYYHLSCAKVTRPPQADRHE